MNTKTCTKCGIERDTSEFCKYKRSKDGLESKCKVCKKKYREENKDEISIRNKEYRERDKEAYNEKQRLRYYQKREERLKKVNDYRANNIEEIREKDRKRYAERKDEINAKRREDYKLNPGKYKELNKKSYAKHREQRLKDFKRYKDENPEKVKKQKREEYEKNIEAYSSRAKKHAEKTPHFSDFKDLLTVTEEPIPDETGLLKVKCTYCDRYYYPTYRAVLKRIRCIKGEDSGELRLYCSDNCKKACSIYGQISYPKGFRPATSREVQPELRKMRLHLDNYECQKCGKSIDEAQLHCHHYTGTVQNPIESADVDNTVTVCKKCHKWVHTQEGCRYFDLRCGKS